MFTKRPDYSEYFSGGDEALSDEEGFLANIAAYSDEEIAWHKYGDFDKDGTYEAFVITGNTDSETESFVGTPWFLTTDMAVEISPSSQWSAPELWELSGDIYLKIEETKDGESLSRLYGVEDSKIYEPAISGRVYDLCKISPTEFTAKAQRYDTFGESARTSEGESTLTEKTYWFYLEEGIFREYGAKTDLKRGDMRMFDTGNAILDELLANGLTAYHLDRLESEGNFSEEEREYVAEKAGVIRNILRRGNGIWHLNYYGAYGDNYYITFREEAGDIKVIDEGEGYYLWALCEDIAVLPTEETEENAEG